MDIKEFFETNSEVAVALSGGVDSSVLLMLAVKYAKRIKAYFAKSAFQPQFEKEDALEIAELFGAEIEVITLDVLSDSAIVSNPPDRCYYCKRRIFGEICRRAKADGFSIVLDGTNASDNVEERAGFKAITELGVRSPLRECGLTKADIRALAKKNGLPVSDKPSYACLATRIPSGTAITADLLSKTEETEGALMKLGYRNFRVRYTGNGARLELGAKERKLFGEMKDETLKLLLKNYDNVSLGERPDE